MQITAYKAILAQRINKQPFLPFVFAVLCSFIFLLYELQRPNRRNCKVWRKRIFYSQIHIPGTLEKSSGIQTFAKARLLHMTWHFAFKAIHFKTRFWVGIFKFWIFDFVEGYWIKFLYMFALQAKFSKLSLVSKLEPLNEGGGAALLQLVMYHQRCTYNKRP